MKPVNHDDVDDDGLKTGSFVPQPNKTSHGNRATGPAGPPIQPADADDGMGAAPAGNGNTSVDPVEAGGGDAWSGSGGEEDGEFGGAMIDEQEYAEEHSQEQLLFEGMQHVLTVRGV